MPELAATATAPAPPLGGTLEALLSRLVAEGVEVGIRERVIVGRVASELAVGQGAADLSRQQRLFLLRARLTPILAKSPADADRVRRAFLDLFAANDAAPARAPSRTEPVTRTAPARPAPTSRPKLDLRPYLIAAGLLALLALLAVAAFYVAHRWTSPALPPAERAASPPGGGGGSQGGASTGPAHPADTLSLDEIRTLLAELTEASAGHRDTSIVAIAHALSPDDGAPARVLITRLERHLARAPDEPFDLSGPALSNAIDALAEIQYPGRTAKAEDIQTAGEALDLDRLPATPANAAQPFLPGPAESLIVPAWASAALAALPLLGFAYWLFGRRRRLKDYLRRRTPTRSPLVNELVVRAPEEITHERTTLTRAALRLGRANEGRSREIDPEATAVATARAAGFPHIVLKPQRSTPEYLVLISTHGAEDHSARRLDGLVAEVAAQNLNVTRYFIAHDANLCFLDRNGPTFRLVELAARYPDHRLIFLGTGDQLLNPGTLAAWTWAEDLVSWERRAILTPRPVEEWGRREIALARLFDSPPLQADSRGLVRLAEFFERNAAPDPEQYRIKLSEVARSWNIRPRRWLTPVPPEDASYAGLESELQRYFCDERGNFDAPAFWWLAACALYPAVRWDLTVYLGLMLRPPETADARPGRLPLYTEERALRLAGLPWFREGFMPDWLRRRLLATLPPAIQAQAAALLQDLLERAVRPDASFSDAIRLRIARERPDARAGRPERDEIFIEALAKADPLALAVPRSLSQLISGLKHSFAAREWAVAATFAVYWIALLLLIPWPSDGPLPTGAWLPLVFLPLLLAAFATRERVAEWAKGRKTRARPRAASPPREGRPW